MNVALIYENLTVSKIIEKVLKNFYPEINIQSITFKDLKLVDSSKFNIIISDVYQIGDDSAFDELRKKLPCDWKGLLILKPIDYSNKNWIYVKADELMPDILIKGGLICFKEIIYYIDFYTSTNKEAWIDNANYNPENLQEIKFKGEMKTHTEDPENMTFK